MCLCWSPRDWSRDSNKQRAYSLFVAKLLHDRVEINWRADRRTILHLHGYDIEIALGPDKPEAMTFVARATGRFAIETHAPPGEEQPGPRHAVLTYLEVHPR